MRIFNRKIHKSVAQESVVEVTECDGVRALHLGSATIQSGMNVKKPFDLELNYSRGIMCFLLFSQNVQRLAIIGLGGGSVTKYIYQYCPEISQTVLEINAQVIAIARSHFYVPENDNRLNIIEADGVQYLQEHPIDSDCLIIDVFDAHGIPANCCTQDFFDTCHTALQDHGIFVMNLWGSDKNFDVYLQRIEQSFQQRVLIMPTGKPGNIIVFGFKDPIKLSEKKLHERAKTLGSLHKIEFVDFLDKLRENNHSDNFISVFSPN